MTPQTYKVFPSTLMVYMIQVGYPLNDMGKMKPRVRQ